jgi:tetratricopeptide (TPR) repeat protein
MGSPIALDPESESRCESLRRALSRSDGFGLFLVLADGEARAEVVRRLAAWSDMGAVPRLETLPTGAEGVRRTLEDSQAGARTAGGWLVPDGDAVVEDAAAIEALNLARDQLWRVVGGPLVLVMAPGRAVQFQQRAADLYEVRRGTWQLRAVAPQRLREMTVGAGSAVDVDALRTWMRELDEDEREERGQVSGWVDARLVIAGQLLEAGAGEEALAQLRRAETLARSVGYHAGIIGALTSTARLLMIRGELDEALRVIERADEEDLEGKDGVLLLDRLELRGAIEMRRGNYTTVMEVAAEGLALAKRHEDSGASADFLAQIAQCHQLQGNAEKALEVLQTQVIPLLEGTDQFGRLAMRWSEAATLYLDRGLLKEAEEVFASKVIPLLEREGRPDQLATATGLLATVLEEQGRLDEALRLLQEVVMPVFERHGAVRERAVTFGKIADVLAKQGLRQESLRLRRREEIPVYERIGDKREVAISLGKMAWDLGALGRLEEALKIQRTQVIPTLEKLGARDAVGNARTQLVALLLQAKQPEVALDLLENDVMPAAEDSQDLRLIAYSRFSHAMALKMLGRFEEATRAMTAVPPLAVTLGDRVLLENAQEALRSLPHRPPSAPPKAAPSRPQRRSGKHQ